MNQTQKIEELEATIAKAQQQIEELKKTKIKRFKPAYHDYYYVVRVDSHTASLYYGGDAWDAATYTFFNFYETEELAEKAVPLMRRSNAIIMAKLLVDPYFEPDWGDKGQVKFYVYFKHSTDEWQECGSIGLNGEPAHVSTREKAQQMCELLTEWGVK